jgi:hypothetical protein
MMKVVLNRENTENWNIPPEGARVKAGVER